MSDDISVEGGPAGFRIQARSLLALKIAFGALMFGSYFYYSLIANHPNLLIATVVLLLVIAGFLIYFFTCLSVNFTRNLARLR